MTTTTTPNRKSPTKEQAMKALIELERKLMIKENEEADKAKRLAREQVEQAALQYVLENLDSLKLRFEVDVYSSAVSVALKFCEHPDKAENELAMPTSFKSLHNTWDNIDERPNGWNPNNMSERDIKKRINDKLKKVNASAVIGGHKSAEPERTPVVKEYLEEFLASLAKASKVADRLVA
jgi:hypothetical protein